MTETRIRAHTCTSKKKGYSEQDRITLNQAAMGLNGYLSAFTGGVTLVALANITSVKFSTATESTLHRFRNQMLF